MIYFVTGKEREGVQKKLHELTAALQKKRPSALLFRMSADEWDSNAFDGIATGQGLFEHKYIVVLDGLFAQEEAAAYLEDKLDELIAADHAFLFVEYSPKAATKKLLEKKAEKTWEVADAASVGKKEAFNIFSLTDALGERNKARLWVLYQKALMQGSEPEEIHGILFWQIKSMLATAQSKTAEDAGLKPFVWGKAQKFLRNYTHDELKKISSCMVGLYHGARLNGTALEDDLESFLLNSIVK